MVVGLVCNDNGRRNPTDDLLVSGYAIHNAALSRIPRYFMRTTCYILIKTRELVMTAISIEVDKDIAQTFFNASANEKMKLQLLLNLRLKELIVNPNHSLLEIMDDMGQYAQSQGMTEELLASLLDEK
jgi:hypothetical protein